MRILPALPLLLVALAGCLTDGDDDGKPTFDDPPTDSVAAAQAAIGAPGVLDHDHRDHTLHTAMHNVEFLDWSHLGIELGVNGFANFVLWESDGEQLAFVAVDGDDTGGFVIADVSDPTDIQTLGSYIVPGNSFQEVRVTPSGNFAVLNIQDLGADAGRLGGAPNYCPVCIHVVDVQDRSSPQLVGYTPVELLGTHNMDFQEQDGALYLYYVGQPLSYTPGSPQALPGNHVWIGRFIETPLGFAALVPVSQFRHDTTNDVGARSFPHDVMVQVHPITGEDIAYVSQWDGGAITFDVSNPFLPQELGQEATFEPSEELAIHWIWQEEWVRPDGKVYAWSAPEIGNLLNDTGVIRAYDVTDPAAIHQVGHWRLPGELSIIDAFRFSPHTVIADPELGVAAVAHYHAGVWILDVSDPTNPQHVGVFQPHGDPEDPYDGPVWWKKPNFNPEGYGPNAYMARWDDRGDDTILWVSDRGTGLYALRYTGPVTGPIA